jgi:hypothetical protein
MNLRTQARGMPCQVRLPGCDGGGETTVLAHYRMLPYCGTGLKPPDALGAWCCDRCHALVDGRRKHIGVTRQDARLAHAEGVLRTTVERERLAA